MLYVLSIAWRVKLNDDPTKFKKWIPTIFEKYNLKNFWIAKKQEQTSIVWGNRYKTFVD